MTSINNTINPIPPDNTIVAPSFYNLLSFSNLNNFVCEIGDATNGYSTLMLQDVSIPSISCPIVEQGNVEIGYQTKTNASEVTYSPIEMSFLLDEEFKSYLYFWNWKEQLLKTPHIPKDIRIFITSNKKNVKYVFFFTGCCMGDIGGFQFSSKITDRTPIAFTVSFEFERMWFEVITE